MLETGIRLPVTQIHRPKREDQFPVLTGRMIYDQLTMSGLNQVPVNMHKYRALRGFSTTPAPAPVASLPAADPSPALPVKPEEVTELLLIEGSAVFNFTPEAEWECVENIVKADDEDVYCLLLPGGEVPVDDPTLRHFKLTGEIPDDSGNGTWEIYDTLLRQWNMSGVENTASSGSIPATQLRVYENGQGILYPAQWMWQRLEEIRWGVRQETSDFALSILLIGMISPNVEASLARLNRGERIASLPGGGGVQVERVGDSRVVDQLEAEYVRLESEYFRLCYLFDDSTQPSRPVGLDLQLRMEPQAAFVEDLRRKIVDVYRMLDYTGTIKFKPLETKTASDISLIITSCVAAVQGGVMDANKARMVIDDILPTSG